MRSRNCVSRLLWAIIFILVVALSFSGCSAVNKPKSTNKATVVSTVFAPFDFAKQIAGDNIDAKLLTDSEKDMHTYTPTPQDIITIQSADVFIYVGGESEIWVDKVLRSIDTSKMQIIKLLNCIEPIEETDFSLDSYNGYSGDTLADTRIYDEHIFSSPQKDEYIVNEIRKTLAKVNPEQSKAYEKSANAYIDKLRQIGTQINTIVSNAKRKKLIFTGRFPLRYLTEDYGLEYIAPIGNCYLKTATSMTDVNKIIKVVNKNKIPVVLKSDNDTSESGVRIANSTGAKLLTINSFHNISQSSITQGATVLSLMQQNIEVLKQALQ